MRGRHLRRDESRVLAEVIDERSERRVTKEGLNECAVASVLLGESSVLGLEVGSLLSLDGDFAFELADVFWNYVSRWSCMLMRG